MTVPTQWKTTADITHKDTLHEYSTIPTPAGKFEKVLATCRENLLCLSTFHKLAKKFDGYKALIKVPAPPNIKAAAKFVMRLVDHWTRWEQSACKLADETCHLDTWRKVENLKPKIEDFAQQAMDLSKWHKSGSNPRR